MAQDTSRSGSRTFTASLPTDAAASLWKGAEILLVIALGAAFLLAFKALAGRFFSEGEAAASPLHAFMAYLPMLMAAYVFGCLGAALRAVLNWSSRNARRYAAQTTLAGGILGAFAYLVLESRVIAHLFYTGFDPAKLAASPQGACLVAAIAGLFAAESMRLVADRN